MLDLGKFTSYYLVSTILPGMCNVAIVYVPMKLFRILPQRFSLNSWEWLLVWLIVVPATLTIGMCIEKTVFSFVKFKESMCYDSIAKWREKLLEQINEEKELKSRQLIANVEKLMSEYYFLNNIIPGILISSIVLLSFFDHPCLWLNVVARVIIVEVMLLALWLIWWVLRRWLCELHSLQSLKIQ